MNQSKQENVKPNITIIVAAHKQYPMPSDPMYLPLHVGAEGKTDENGQPLDLGYVKDNTGDNISELNPGFCELTGLYWAWKNLDSDYIGLVHYRRHFSYSKDKESVDHVLTEEEIRPDLGRIRVFTPNKRKYYIESLYDHYKHTRYILPLDEARVVISEMYPEYLDSFDLSVRKTWGYMFNMMIMEKELLDSYCRWLFDILFELKKRLDQDETIQNLSTFQRRFYGCVSEILFNVWLNRQIETGVLSKSELKEIPVVHMGQINWWKKGTSFLLAKFAGKQYSESF